MRRARLTAAVIVQVLLLVLSASCGGDGSVSWDSLPDRLSGGVVVYGDSRTGHSVHRGLVEGMAEIGPAAVFHTGDIVSDGLDPDRWAVFNDIIAGLPPGTPFYPALGNHEKDSPLYFANFDLPGDTERWYSVDIGADHFVVLDSGSDLFPASSQYGWLTADLAAASGADHTLVLFHHPLLSTGHHGPDEKGLASDLMPLFESAGVDAVFTGHDHDFERFTVGGIRYLVTGGGGAPLRGRRSTDPRSEVFVKAHHFCVLYHDTAGDLMVEIYDNGAGMIDSFVVNRN